MGGWPRKPRHTAVALLSLSVVSGATGRTGTCLSAVSGATHDQRDGSTDHFPTHKKGNSSAPNSIGRGTSGSCGTVTIGGTIYYDGSAYQNGGEPYLATSPLDYQPQP